MISNKQIAAAALVVLKAAAAGDTGRTGYLRLVIAATQTELQNQTGLDKGLQLAALKTVHQHFYSIVLHEAERFVPESTIDRAIELHRRVNFARTAASAIRNHVRAGADLCTLNADTVTKGELTAWVADRRRPTVKRLRATIQRFSTKALQAVNGLADVDREAALEELRTAVAQWAEQLQAFDEASPVGRTAEAVHAASRGVGAPGRVNRNVNYTNRQPGRSRSRPPTEHRANG